MNTGSKRIVVNKAQIERMGVAGMGARVITNPTLQEARDFVEREHQTLPPSRNGFSSPYRTMRFVVDKNRGNVHFAHANKVIHADIIKHFGIGEDHATGFMEWGLSKESIDSYEPSTQHLLRKYQFSEAETKPWVGPTPSGSKQIAVNVEPGNNLPPHEIHEEYE